MFIVSQISRRLGVAILLPVILCGFWQAAALNAADPPLKALILDGQNNHGMWPKTTFMMKHYLEQTGLFSVDIARTRYTWQGDALLEQYAVPGIETTPMQQPTPDPDFKPDFQKYNVVISNLGYNAATWPEETRRNFIQYVKNGGGLVIVHAANNSFGDWPEYNEMIGLGGWGGRNEQTGPYVFVDDAGAEVRDNAPGRGGSHGRQHEFSVVVRNPEHSITQGMPREWRHTQDELYDRLRGPGQNMEILATAYADPETGGSGRHEPMLMTIRYGKGRVFHTPMGHADYSMECVGFKVSLQRGTEWAATGKVTQPIPENFPTAEKLVKEAFEK